MKKIISIILSICMFLALTAGLNISAYSQTEEVSEERVEIIANYDEGKKSFEYTGLEIRPQVIAYNLNGDVIDSSFYEITFYDNIEVGRATVIVEFNGDYSGTVAKTFNILPPSITIQSLLSGNKKITVRWNSLAEQVSGYQIQIATDDTFTNNVKSYTVENSTAGSHTLNNLQAKKKYYVRIRSFKNVEALKYYSVWSSVKSATTNGVSDVDVDEHSDHTFVETYFAPTCTDVGYKRYNCSDCGYYYDEVYTPATGHIPETVLGKSPSCTENGLTNGSRCSVCGITLAYQQNVSPTGHNWDAGKVVKEATAAYSGSKLYTCRNCGEITTEEIPKYNATTANPIKVTALKNVPSVKSSALKKKDQCIAFKKVAKVQKSKGPVTYAKASGNSKRKIDSKTGKITLKRGLRKGTYKVKIKVKDAGTKKYKASTKTVTIKIKVK